MEMTCEQAIIILKAIYTNVLHCDEAPYTTMNFFELCKGTNEEKLTTTVTVVI